MKNTPLLVLTSLLILTLYSCNQSPANLDIIKHGKNKEFHIRTYDIKDSLHIRMSDFANGFEFIRLESGKDYMISYGLKNYVNDEYFITEKFRGDIYQFGRDGRFIRKLVVKGKGPTEFVDAKWTVDDVNQILYLSDRAKNNYFLRFDLKTGNYLGDLKKAYPGRTYDIHYTENDILMVVPSGSYKDREYPDYIYYQDLDGNIQKSIPAPEGLNLLYNQLSYSYGDDQYRFGISNNDTIFSVFNNELIPYLTFDFGKPNPQNRLEMGHIDVSIYKETSSWLWLEVGEVSEVTKNQYGEVIDLASRMSHWALDKKQGIAFNKGSLYIDPTHDKKGGWVFYCKNGWFVKPYDALFLIEHAEKVLNDPDFIEPYRSKFKDLIGNLSPEDNPVLLVGKYK